MCNDLCCAPCVPSLLRTLGWAGVVLKLGSPLTRPLEPFCFARFEVVVIFALRCRVYGLLKTHRQGDAHGVEHNRILKVFEGGERDITSVMRMYAALQEDVDTNRDCIHQVTREFFVVSLAVNVSMLILRYVGVPR